MADREFGEIPGIVIGTEWQTRREVALAGIHRPTMNGISGTEREGADSIVVSGGYEDDEDFGSEIIYTGTGGYDAATGKQTADQTFDNTNNAALIKSQFEGLPVRVVRGAKGNPLFSPKSGYRYDGLFQVLDHWSEIGKSGFRVCRYRLRQIEPNEVIQPATFVVSKPPVGEINPSRIRSITTRTVRSTSVSEFVKKLYKYRCQICESELLIPKGFISEGAHIRALGRPHNGPDIVENIICLCPNHHSLLDLGGIYISDKFEVYDLRHTYVSNLKIDSTHKIDPAFTAYHRGLWGY
jgi:putative restriction endonuclease